MNEKYEQEVAQLPAGWCATDLDEGLDPPVYRIWRATDSDICVRGELVVLGVDLTPGGTGYSIDTPTDATHTFPKIWAALVRDYDAAIAAWRAALPDALDTFVKRGAA
jgi:hypothetical protein